MEDIFGKITLVVLLGCVVVFVAAILITTIVTLSEWIF